MLWLKKLQIKLCKNRFGNTVLLQCHSLIYELVENDKGDAIRKTAHETTIIPCFDIIRRRNERHPKETYDMREQMIKKVVGIVQSDNPIISMRKELLHLIHTTTLNRTFFAEEFCDRRKEIEESLNKYMDDADMDDISDTVDVPGTLCIWGTAELYILRLLHHEYFEKAEEDDWFSRYSQAYSIYMETLFRIDLAQRDGEDCSIYAVTFPVMKKQVEQFQQQLIGEVIVLEKDGN